MRHHEALSLVYLCIIIITPATSVFFQFVYISFTILPFYMHAIVSFILVISESKSKQVLLSPPHNRLCSHLSNTSPSASHKISEAHSSPEQTKATYTQLKCSPRGQKSTMQQTWLQSPSAKKQTDTPKKSKRSPKEHKTEKSELGIPGVSLEEILALFQPMLPCISPLPNVVRIQLCFIQMLFKSCDSYYNHNG